VKQGNATETFGLRHAADEVCEHNTDYNFLAFASYARNVPELQSNSVHFAYCEMLPIA